MVEPLQYQYLRAAEQCGVQREAGIFGGRADQCNGAAFDEWQEAVLLCAVETVNLVNKQQRALARLGGLVCGGESLLQIGDTAKDRTDAFEAHTDAVRE